MSSSRPRPSLLSLFDPLSAANSSTPPRDARDVSALDGESDKENDGPESYSDMAGHYYDSDRLTMTMFFNRTYSKTSNVTKHISPLRNRLIDVPINGAEDDEDWDAENENENQENQIQKRPELEGSPLLQVKDVDSCLPSLNAMSLDDLKDENLVRPASSFKTPSSSPVKGNASQRTPLADISVEATPMPPKLPAAFEMTSAFSPKTVVRPKATTQPQQGSPLVSVINKIGLSDRTAPDSHVQLPSDQRLPSGVSSVQDFTPSIVISEAGYAENGCIATSKSFAVLPSPPHARGKIEVESPVVRSASSPPPQPRPRRPTAPVAMTGQDPRQSVDLQTSFNWQMQCPEASFDLINDRVSFFGGESFSFGDLDGHEFDETKSANGGKQQQQTELNSKMEVHVRAMSPRLSYGDSPSAGGSSPLHTIKEHWQELRPEKDQVIRERASSVSPIRELKGRRVSAPMPPSPLVGGARSKPSTPITTKKPDSLSPTRKRSSTVVGTQQPSLLAASPKAATAKLASSKADDSPPSSRSRRRSSTVIGAGAQQSALRLTLLSPKSSASPAEVPLPMSPLPRLDLSPVIETPSKSATEPSVPLAPAPVQALRIVKRAASSASGGSSSASSSAEALAPPAQVITKRQSRPSLDVAPAAPTQPTLRRKPTLRGVQRPPLGAATALSSVKSTFQPTQASSGSEMEDPATVAPKVSAKSRLTSLSMLRTKIAPAPDAVLSPLSPTGSTAPAQQSKASMLKGTATSTLKRMASMSGSSAASKASSGAAAPAGTKGIQPRLSVRASSSGLSASALPRPAAASKLPVPGAGGAKAASASGPPRSIGRSGITWRG